MAQYVKRLDWLANKIKRCLDSDYGKEMEISEQIHGISNKEGHINAISSLIEKSGLMVVRIESVYNTIKYIVVNVDDHSPDPDLLRDRDRQAMMEALRTILSLLKHRVSNGHTAILGWDELRTDGKLFPVYLQKQLIHGLRNHGIPVRESKYTHGVEFDADYETIRKIEGYTGSYSENVAPRQYLIPQKTTK